MRTQHYYENRLTDDLERELMERELVRQEQIHPIIAMRHAIRAAARLLHHKRT